MRLGCRAVLCGGLIGLVLAGGVASSAELVLTPGAVELRGAGGRQQLIATEMVAERPVDRTREVTWRSETPAVVDGRWRRGGARAG